MMPESDNDIRLLIADDHAVVREGLRGLITSESGMELVGEAADGAEAVAAFESTRPDVILLDLVMPRKDGLEVIREIKAIDPAARILVLTSYAGDEQVFTAIKRGALGYLLKDSSPSTLLQAIRDVYRGETSLHPLIARKLVQEIRKPEEAEQPLTEEPLTGRELEVLSLLARGWTNPEIATELVISEHTVRTHVGNILSKLHLANRTQAALYAVREGFVDLDDALEANSSSSGLPGKEV
jgi:NarL family two-component system response regulator LiaR